MKERQRSTRRAPAGHAHAVRGYAHRTGSRGIGDLREELGASRSFSVVSRPRGPFGVAALLDEVKTRLISRGGRPSDPSPTVRRLVPLKKQVWRRLQTQAEHLSGLGKRVSPGQLAAMLLERSIDELEHPQREKPPV